MEDETGIATVAKHTMKRNAAVLAMTLNNALRRLDRSEFRIAGLRQRHHVVIEVLGVVLGADHLDHGLVIGPPITLDRVPRRRKRARIFDMHVHFDRPAAIDQFELFDHMELCRVWRAIIVDKRLLVHPNRVDDESIAALVMPDGFTVPGWLGLGGVTLA